MKVNNKKQLVLTLIAVVTLLVLVGGATYAYFSAAISNNFGTASINAEAETLGTVTLDGNSTTLSMNLTGLNMAKNNAGTLYASTSGTTTTPTLVPIGTGTVSPSTDTNYYECSYTLNITKSGTMYDAFTGNGNSTKSAGQIIMTIGDEEFDWYSDTFPTTVTGTFGTRYNNPGYIEAGLRVVNLENTDQSAIEGTSISINISLASGSLVCSVAREIEYYGWQELSYRNYVHYKSFDTARGTHLIAIKEDIGSGDKWVCALINGEERCVSPETDDVFSEGTISCSSSSNTHDAMCSNYDYGNGIDYNCHVNNQYNDVYCDDFSS